MGAVIDINKNPVLLRWQNEFLARGRAEGRAEGKIELLKDMLTAKFGPVPQWAEDRLAKATSAQLQRWGVKLATAKTIEGVMGRR